MNDGDLLEAWRSGDVSAGDKLLRRHFDAVYRLFASKLGPDVQDLVQHTFAECVTSRERIVPSGFRVYLLGIARHRLIDELRRRGSRPDFDPAVSSLADLGCSPSAALQGADEERILRRALHALPLALQLTLELFYWESMSTAEIGRVTGVSEHTARSRLSRARQRLREEIERIADSPGVAASTLDGLDTWAERLARTVGADG